MISNLFKLGKTSLLVVSVLSFSTHAAITKTFTINEDTRDTHTILEVMFYQTGYTFYQVTKHPSKGAITASSSQISYLPNSNYCGSDSISYTARRYDDIGPIYPIEPIHPIEFSSPYNKFEPTYSISSGGYVYETININYTIKCVNDQPQIVPIADKTTFVNTATSFRVLVTDVDSSNLQISAYSSTNSTLIPTSKINSVLVTKNAYNGSYYSSLYEIQLTPAQGKTGSAVITLKASDGSNTQTYSSFKLDVNGGGTPKPVVYVHTDLLGSPVVESN